MPLYIKTGSEQHIIWVKANNLSHCQ
uniref:Uncharacterized protein n=1 Tax=Rhizophora mucronata TaxID=61149 RepID=A0A2P2P7Q3_RHIMU